MKYKILKLIIEHDHKIFLDKKTNNIEQKINLYDLVNEYHYNFYSSRNYKISCDHIVFSCLCLGISISSMLFFIYTSSSDNSLFNKTIYNVVLYLLSIVGFFVGVIENKNLVGRQIFNKFTEYLEKSEKIQLKESRHKFLFSILNRNMLKNLVLRWLDSKINRKNYLSIASEISNALELLNKHSLNNRKSIISLIYTTNSKARSTSYLIALLSLISLILISNSSDTELYKLLSEEALKLYLQIVFLIIELLLIIYMFQFIVSDILSILKDKFDDLFKQDEIPNKQRINRLINLLVINHEHRIK